MNLGPIKVRLEEFPFYPLREDIKSYNLKSESDHRLISRAVYPKDVLYRCDYDGYKLLSECRELQMTRDNCVILKFFSKTNVYKMVNQGELLAVHFEYDIVYENGSNEGKIVNLPEKIVPILQANVEYDLPVFVGSSLFPIAEHLIPKNTLRSSNDLMIKLSEVLSTQCEFNNFVISLHHVNGKILIELIPETGAA